MDVYSENLANANMSGYKRLTAVHAPFAEQLDQQVAGESSNSIQVDHSQGAFRPTGQASDFAIEGNGYFVVADGERQFLTRNGHFTVASDGALINSAGMRLQGAAGDIRLPPDASLSQIELDADLTMHVGTQTIGQLKLATADPAALVRVGNTLFSAPAELEAATDCQVITGHLEQSNTSVFEELTGMMTTMRNYEACQKMLRTVDEAETSMMSKLA